SPQPHPTRFPSPLTLHSFPTRRSSDLALLSSLLAFSCAKNNQTESRTETDNPAGFVYAGDPPPAELPSLEQLEAQSEFDSLTEEDRKSTRLNSSHVKSSYAVFCLTKKN